MTNAIDILLELTKREGPKGKPSKGKPSKGKLINHTAWLRSFGPYSKTCQVAHALNPSDVVGYLLRYPLERSMQRAEDRRVGVGALRLGL
jgi:hypothetical protein